ncbi:hypothetical protein ES702_02623 [subsurface metagenome]
MEIKGTNLSLETKIIKSLRKKGVNISLVVRDFLKILDDKIDSVYDLKNPEKEVIKLMKNISIYDRRELIKMNKKIEKLEQAYNVISEFIKDKKK